MIVISDIALKLYYQFRQHAPGLIVSCYDENDRDFLSSLFSLCLRRALKAGCESAAFDLEIRLPYPFPLTDPQIAFLNRCANDALNEIQAFLISQNGKQYQDICVMTWIEKINKKPPLHSRPTGFDF